MTAPLADWRAPAKFADDAHRDLFAALAYIAPAKA
jgi:hypothetical protein